MSNSNAASIADLEKEIELVKKGDYTYQHKLSLIRDLQAQIRKIKLDNSVIVDGELNGAELDNAA